MIKLLYKCNKRVFDYIILYRTRLIPINNGVFISLNNIVLKDAKNTKLKYKIQTFQSIALGKLVNAHPYILITILYLHIIT